MHPHKFVLRLVRADHTYMFFPFILGVVFFWWIISLLQIWPHWVFPSPFDVVESLLEMFGNGYLLKAVLVSFRRLCIGFGLSLCVGTLLGLLLARYSWLQKTVGVLILGIQTLPSLCWLPLALLWFGLNESAIIFVILMGTFVSIAISVKSAVLYIPIEYIHTGRLLGAKGMGMYRHVFIPAILPEYISGMKQAWSFSWRSLISGEMIFISSGLGQLLMFGRELNDVPQVVGVMVVIVLMGLGVDVMIFRNLEIHVRRRWGLSEQVK